MESSGDKEVRKPESRDLKTMQATFGHKYEAAVPFLEKLLGEQMNTSKKNVFASLLPKSTRVYPQEVSHSH